MAAVTTSNFVSLNQLLSAKVSNGNTAAMSEIRSNLTIKTPERRYWFFFSFYIVHRRSFWLQRWCCTYFTHLFWCFHRWHSASNADTVRERLHIWLLTLSKSKRIIELLFSQDFRGYISSEFTWICLIKEAKFGDDPSLTL